MNRAKTIVTATDFSAGAECAVVRADMLAREYGCALTLVHVFNDSAWNSFDPERPAEADRLAAAQERLRAVSERLQHERGIHVESKVVAGRASREIVALVRRHPARLVVVGAHRQPRLRDVMVGGTALKVMRDAGAPVLMVRRAPEHPYATVVVATDFSDAAARATHLASEAFPAAVLHLVHAYDTSFEDLMRLDGADGKDIGRRRKSVEQKALSALDVFARECNADQASRHVVAGPPAEVILDQSGVLAADVVVLGRHGGSAVEEHLFGSVTQNVLYHAACDVLVVP